jgi:hypothetical protein
MYRNLAVARGLKPEALLRAQPVGLLGWWKIFAAKRAAVPLHYGFHLSEFRKAEVRVFVEGVQSSYRGPPSGRGFL